jgi:2-polyprenyl-6-methoxyphenol hydroxylase-like FAD-dependent oxidoreductase
MTHDIVVCGAGPAGSVAARRLAAAGARVALVGTRSRPGWEGLSARSRALLRDEGLDRETDVIAGPFARRGLWADGRSVQGTEWLVERSQLAESLRAGAQSAGVDYRPDSVTSATRAAGHWRVDLRAGGMLTAPVLIDARGRRGVPRRGPLLLAFAQRFRRRTCGAPGTGIGVTDAGWCWWAERDQALWVQVVGRPRSGHPAAWAAAAAAQIPALARALDGASMDGDPVARPADARLGTAGQDPTLWLVGDAALALDPLSGQGVYEALRGARLTATAIQSVLGGGDPWVAQRFIAERRAEAWQRGVRVAAEFYRENRDRGAFWMETAAAYAALRPASAAPLSATAAPLIASAAAPTDGARDVGTRIERRPVLDAGRIIERDVFVTADHPRGVWHVAGVPVAALKAYLDSAERATTAGAAAALGRPQAAVASAIRWLQQAGAAPASLPRVSSGG